MSEVPAAPAPAPAPAPATYPGKGLGIAGLILAIFFNLIGLIVSIVAYNQSKKAGYKNGPAKAGIIIGIILLVLGVVIAIAAGVAAGAAAAKFAEICSEYGSGVWEDGAVTYTCP